MTDTLKTKGRSPFQFLIIGYGNELKGDDAVGLKVADVVSSWRLPEVKSISVHQLTPELVNNIVDTDYVIFVDACGGNSCARTVQLDPVLPGAEWPKAMAKETHVYNPLTLLTLTKQLYGQAPQAWMLQIPTERFALGEGLSSTALRGCDRALITIAQFFKTYKTPTWVAA